VLLASASQRRANERAKSFDNAQAFGCSSCFTIQRESTASQHSPEPIRYYRECSMPRAPDLILLSIFGVVVSATVRLATMTKQPNCT
jgi:hypothetical protein